MQWISRFIGWHKKLIGPCLVVLSFGNAWAQVYSPLILSDQTFIKIDSICLAQQEQFHYPGLAVTVIAPGGKIWMKGYGYADLENKVRINPQEHLFRIGSISKTITATALARLYERNEINLDLAIGQYMPSLPPDKGELTLRQLGGHLAGIRHYLGFEFFSNLHYTNVTDPLEVFIHDSLTAQPGARYGYSTYGWTLISAVMENAVHKPFLQIIDEEVVQPLKLTNLKADQIDSIQYPRVHFYDYRDSTWQSSAQVDISNKWAGGGFLCSAEELAQFGYAIVNSDFLQPSTLTTFTSSQIDSSGKAVNYGIGFRLGKDQMERSWFGHSGGSIGGTSMLLMYPDEDLVVVTLINLTEANMDGLAWKIGEALLNEIHH